MSVTIRPAVAEDFSILTHGLPPYRVSAWTGEVDGRVIGVGGICHMPNGVKIAFVDINDEARKYPVALHKIALRVVAEARMARQRLIATCDPDWPVAGRWLERLGFYETGQMVEGRKVFACTS